MRLFLKACAESTRERNVLQPLSFVINTDSKAAVTESSSPESRCTSHKHKGSTGAVTLVDPDHRPTSRTRSPDGDRLAGGLKPALASEDGPPQPALTWLWWNLS